MKKGCWKRVICLRQKVCALCVTVEQQYLFLLSYTVDTRLRKSRETYFGTRPPFPSHHYLLSRAALLLRLYTTYYILLTSMWQKWNDCELNATFYAVFCSRSIISTVIYGHPICNIYCMLQTLGELPAASLLNDHCSKSKKNIQSVERNTTWKAGKSLAI